MCLESDQARWAKECSRGGNCPICNPKEEEVPEKKNITWWGLQIEWDNRVKEYVNVSMPEELANQIDAWLETYEKENT